MLVFGRLSLRIVWPEAKLAESSPPLATVIFQVQKPGKLTLPPTSFVLVAVRSGAGVACGLHLPAPPASKIALTSAAPSARLKISTSSIWPFQKCPAMSAPIKLLVEPERSRASESLAVPATAPSMYNVQVDAA